MIKGIYTAASGMIAAEIRQDTITNNLANADTPGFKKAGTVNETFSRMLLSRLEGTDQKKIGYLGTGSEIAGSWTDFSTGELKETGNPLDLAIRGEGFFAVETPAGERYTRTGAFLLDEGGYLVTPQGYRVLGENGPVQLDTSLPVEIDRKGNVYQQGRQVATLRLVSFARTENLLREGNGLFAASGEVTPANAQVEVLSGYLEESNVNLIREMTEMIETVRYYQLNQKLISIQDQTLAKAVNEAGRLK